MSAEPEGHDMPIDAAAAGDCPIVPATIEDLRDASLLREPCPAAANAIAGPLSSA
jgi:hypothetical protein